MVHNAGIYLAYLLRLAVYLHNFGCSIVKLLFGVIKSFRLFISCSSLLSWGERIRIPESLSFHCGKPSCRQTDNESTCISRPRRWRIKCHITLDARKSGNSLCLSNDITSVCTYWLFFKREKVKNKTSSSDLETTHSKILVCNLSFCKI